MFIVQVDRNIELKMMGHKDHVHLFELIETNWTYLRQWLPWVDQHTEPSHSEQFISQAFEQHANRQALSAGIFYQQQLVGVIGFTTYDWQNRIGTIGYWLAESFQGKGIMTRSLKAVLTYGFTQLDLNRIQLFSAFDNDSSKAIPERLGFTKEGLIRENERLHNRYVDHILYSILKREWLDSNP